VSADWNPFVVYVVVGLTSLCFVGAFLGYCVGRAHERDAAAGRFAIVAFVLAVMAIGVALAVWQGRA
jgi:hypothetical protein